MNLELKKAIDQISKDKGIDREMLIDTLEEAIRASVTKKYGDKMDIEVTFNEETARSKSTSSKSWSKRSRIPTRRSSWSKQSSTTPTSNLTTPSDFACRSRILAASPLKAPSRSSSSACATPNRKSSTRNTKTARARSSAASSSVVTVPAGSSTSAGPRPSCPRTSRFRVNASVRATGSRDSSSTYARKDAGRRSSSPVPIPST